MRFALALATALVIAFPAGGAHAQETGGSFGGGDFGGASGRVPSAPSGSAPESGGAWGSSGPGERTRPSSRASTREEAERAERAAEARAAERAAEARAARWRGARVDQGDVPRTEAERAVLDAYDHRWKLYVGASTGFVFVFLPLLAVRRARRRRGSPESAVWPES